MVCKERGAKLPKTFKITRRSQYTKIHKTGAQYKGRWVFIQAVKAVGREQTRFGITVTRRFGKAHVRNRFKRLAREAFRLSQTTIPKGYDINIMPRKHAVEATLEGIQQDLRAFAR